MQPLKPEERQTIREDHPQTAPEDLERYEKLLSLRFTQDPDAPVHAPMNPLAAESAAPQRSIEEELQELHQRIFESSPKTHP